MSKFLFPGIISQQTYNPITLNYISRMTTKPSVEHIKLINDFVLTTKNIINKADVIYLCNINNSNDSFVNLVKNAHNGTISGNTLIYDEYWGWSNPSGNTLVNTNYNPYTDGVNYTRDNAGYTCYIQGSNQPSEVQYVMGSFQSTSIRTSFNVNTVVATVNYIVNDGSNNSVGEVAFRSGYNYGGRESSSTKRFRNRNILDITHSVNSTGVPNVNWFLFGITNGSNYTGNLSFVYIGASLTEDENKILDDAVNDYLIQCLFLKYGQDNWGVKMAKSYFLDLHNFEKYEAWEVYEFIKRHQSNYYEDNIIPTASSNFETDGTSWWSKAYSDLVWNSIDYCAKIVGKGSGSARIYRLNYTSIIPNSIYRVRFKYRSSNISTKTLSVYINSTYIGAQQTNLLSTEWQQYDNLITAITDDFNISLISANVGDEYEVDDIIIEPFAYLYNTFGLSGQNKTVADYILLFKAGGNLKSNLWSKTGDVLRWNQDGIITKNNTMPVYTRGGNLGIVTVTTTDSFDNVTAINLNQTTSSVNSFYGNFPLFEKLKTTHFIYLFGSQNRIKIDLLSSPIIIRSLSFPYISTVGYLKIDLNKYIGASLNGYITISNTSQQTKVYGNMSLYTTEYNSGRNVIIQGSTSNIFDLNGTLNNWVYQGTYTQINIQYTNLTGGLLNWNRNLDTVNFSNNYFSTDAVDAQLKSINDYFTTTTPIKNLRLSLSGTNMGIPTGGSSNTDLLGIISKYTAAGYTATIIVRTS
jgi:hypothetical protein